PRRPSRSSFWKDGASALPMTSAPIRLADACCARAASGHAAALPSSVMNSRRLMSSFHLPKRSLPHETPDQNALATSISRVLVALPPSGGLLFRAKHLLFEVNGNRSR